MVREIMLAGMRAAGWSEKNDTPEGRDKTPAPMIHFARLKVEAAMVAPSALGFSFTATADMNTRELANLIFVFSENPVTVAKAALPTRRVVKKRITSLIY
jgi:hypothetical protein